ncbi:MAG TPA: DegT/DnrJ/EryC1/StrS family aminotransferase [Pyrinomonadaceae bacterium]|nr:DegT/DnrJ/EryC1/StrS family aminotransferase [Pyrinomonadaceae bacterium]
MSEQAVAGRRKVSGARPFFHDEDVPQLLSRLERILRGGRLIFGENTREFEDSFRDYVGTRHAVSVNSCTTALEIVMRFFNVKGREVIVPTNTFASCVKAVMYAGGTPVLADMDPETFCLDTDDVLSRINSKTAGLIVVHIAGLVYPEIDRLREECRERGLFLIEDPSHAHGATIDDRPAGSLSDAACFSFYPTKIMTTGTGGMITTDNAELAQYARSVRHHGQGESLESIVNLGNDWCMDEMSAALGVYQLKRLDESVEHRNRVVEWYRRELSEVDWISVPLYAENLRHAYYKFPVMLDEGVDKKKLRQIMFDEYQVELGSIYDPPCHLHPVFQKELGCYAGQFPKAEAVLRRQICLPVHAVITEEDVKSVVAALQEAEARVRV